MSDATQGIRVDDELLAFARTVLVGERYVVEDVTADGVRLLLAENRYFVLAVVAAATIEQIVIAEGWGEEFLVGRLRSANMGPKLWDAYLVLLTQELLPDRGDATRELFQINYDTRGVRRMAHSGVFPRLADVRNALTPFVAPIELDDPTIATNAFDSFIEALVARGIDREVAVRAVTASRQGADIADAL
jgi:hypothetical protein